MRQFTVPFILMFASVLSMGGTRQSISAAELDPHRVPADAKWLVHLDLEQILETKLAQRVREAQPELTRQIRGWMQERYGIDLPNDLHSATMFSRSYGSYTGTIILQADYDAEKVEADILKDEQVQTAQWEGYTLYTWGVARQRPSSEPSETPNRAEEKQVTVVMVDDETVVFTSSMEDAQSTLQLLAGDGESLHGTDSFLLAGASERAMMHGAAIDLQEIAESDVPMPVLRQHDRIRWTIGERDGMVYEDAVLIAQSEEVSEQMEQFLEGMLALGHLWAADSEPLKELLDASEIARDGKTIEAHWEADGDQVLAGLEELQRRLGQAK